MAQSGTTDEMRRLLKIAEFMFKLSVKHTAEAHVGKLPIAWSFGMHTITQEELTLSGQQELLATVALEHCATYIIALELDSLLAQVVPDRLHHVDDEIRSCCWIARLLRNAFAHNPLEPEWKTYPECDNQTYSVPGVIRLSTAGRQGKPVDRLDYGGPIALLKLSEWARQRVLAPAIV